MDEHRRTDEDQRGDVLTARPESTDGEEPGIAGSDSLPRSVRRQLDSCAADWLRERDGLPRRQSRAGWYAAAACLAIAVLGWWPRLTSWQLFDSGSSVGRLSAELARERMVESGAATVRRWPWSVAAGSAPGLTGDVVWDAALQHGYLQFSGLEPNDPARHQYQLWILDATRDQRYPVDGGVFDIRASKGPLVIPVRATIPVREPAAFVVTVERPGGTVVSNHERVVAVALPANR